MTERFLSRFTPSLMRQEDLEAIFVQRKLLAERLIELVRTSVLTPAKHHTLLVGPRGIGKTHLVSLIYYRLRQMANLKESMVVAWLREEEWGVTSFLDILLRILRAMVSDTREHSNEQAQAIERSIDTLYAMPNGDAELAAGKLLKEIAGHRTMLLIVENLDQIFNNVGDIGQKQLRSYMQENPFITIVATSVSLFDGVSLQTSPFYGFFRLSHLKELRFDEAVDFLEHVARYQGERELASFIQTPAGRARIRAIYDLTGGNHRIFVILSEFLTPEALDEVIGPFMRMLDELTPYYEERMRWLSPQQRKIVELLCDMARAVNVKEIARRTFMTHQTASGQLRTLRELGYVKSKQNGRESFYELREPLMRLTAEVKKARGAQIRMLIDFLRSWHSPETVELRLDKRLVNELAQGRWEHVRESIGNIFSQSCRAHGPSSRDSDTLVRAVMDNTRDTGAWESRVRLLVEIYEKYEGLHALGIALVRQISELANSKLTSENLDIWRDTWVRAAGDRQEFVAPLRLLSTALKYIKSKDSMTLLEIAEEERRVLEPLLGTSDKRENDYDKLPMKIQGIDAQA